MARKASDGAMPQTVTDAALSGLVGYRMKRAFNAIRADLLGALEPFGLRVLTFTALSLIGENPGLNQSQLAAAMAMERPNVVGVVDELERRGLVARDRGAHDRRSYALRLTDAGTALLSEATTVVAAHEAAMVDRLGPEARSALLALLAGIEEAAASGPSPDMS